MTCIRHLTYVAVCTVNGSHLVFSEVLELGLDELALREARLVVDELDDVVDDFDGLLQLDDVTVSVGRVLEYALQQQRVLDQAATWYV